MHSIIKKELVVSRHNTHNIMSALLKVCPMHWLLIDLSQDGMTALMLASVENHADVVRILLTYGASVNATDQV